MILPGRQGQKVAFEFAGVPLPVDADAAAGGGSPYNMHVSGTITGRMKPDGTIEVVLQPSRSMKFPTGGGALGMGAKTFTLKPDETVSVEIPPETGFSEWRTDYSTRPLINPRAGVSVTGDGWIRVDSKTFLAGTKTSILVTVRR